MRGLGYLADDLRGSLGIGAGAQMHAVIDDLRLQVVRVHQRAVVRKSDEHIVDGRNVGLCSFPGIDAAAGGIAYMADGQVALQRGKRAFVERLGNKAKILVGHDSCAIAHGNARRLLSAMLQGLKAEAGHAGNIFARSVDAENTALLFHPVGALSGKHRRAHVCCLLVIAVHDRVCA